MKPPRSVVAHTVLIHAGFARIMFFKLAGWFHWKVRARLHRSLVHSIAGYPCVMFFKMAGRFHWKAWVLLSKHGSAQIQRRPFR